MVDAVKELTGMPKLPISSELMRSAPAAPKGYMGPRELAPAMEELQGGIAAAEERVGKADIGIEKAKREEEARGLDVKADVLSEYAKDIEQMPERQALKQAREQLKGMEFIPTKDTVQDIAGLFSLIGVIGTVIAKGDAQRALGAMNGMLEGHMKGRKDLFKQQQIEFDKNFKAMQAKISSALSEYQEALELKKTDKEAGEAKKQAALKRSESPLLNAMDEKLGEVRTLNIMKKTFDNTLMFAQMRNELQSKVEDRELRRFQIEAQKELQKELARIRAGERLGTAGTRATIYQRTGKLVPTDKEAEAIGSIADAVDEVSRLREKLKNPKVQTGLVSSLAPAIQKISSVTQPLDEAQFKNLVDQELTGNDETTLFIKDALLASFKIEQGLVGSRVPVATQRVVGPILDPRAYNKQTFDKLLSEREDLLYKNANRRGFEKKDIDALFIEPVPGVEQTPPSQSGKPTPTQADIDFVKANPKYRDKFIARFGREP